MAMQIHNTIKQPNNIAYSTMLLTFHFAEVTVHFMPRPTTDAGDLTSEPGHFLKINE